MPTYTFSKKEHLKSRKTIAALFKQGKAITAYPIKVIWLETTATNSQQFPIEFSLTVPKRAFKKAVHRNRIRRLIRESYRLHKHRIYPFLEAKERTFAIMVIYIAKEEMSYAKIEKSMIKALSKMEGVLR